MALVDGEGREVLFALVNPPADFEVRKPDILKRLTGLTPKDLMLPSAVQEVQEMVRQKVQGCIWWAQPPRRSSFTGVVVDGGIVVG